MKVYHNSFYAMGSRFNVVFPANDEEVCEKSFLLMKNEVLRIESRLSYFNSHSDVYKINQCASQKCVELDDELFYIIKTCLDYAQLTHGMFDITLRPIIDYIQEEKSAFINNDICKSHLNEIELDGADRTIFFKSDKVKIDFGGFGKGYALEKIKPLLNNMPIENAFISFGESSILVKGKHPSGKNWRVSIKNFYHADEQVHTFELYDSSVSSSSNYFVDDYGKLLKKINVLNPATGLPIDELAIASVKSISPLCAEILSTAFLIMEKDQINDVLNKIQDVDLIKVHYEDNKPIKTIFNRIK